MIGEITRWVKAKVSNILTRAVVIIIKETSGQMFVQVEGLKDDIHSDVEFRQQYGFRSKPPAGVRGILLAYGGDSDNQTFILADNKEIEKTPAFEDGESRQFDDTGNARHRIYGGKHYLQGDAYELRIDANNLIEFASGSLKFTVGGEVYEFTPTELQTTTADVKAKTISVLNHVHAISSGSSAPGPTAAPTP